MTTTHGFELIKERDIPEINSHVRLFRHIRTGLELLSVENDDENKSFGVTFATPPSDSTGVPHIIEHSVLNGSRKYPVKDPFKQMIKGSQATFINAMTSDDRTMYPVASQNLQDFYNLVDVYMDAVFYPNIGPEVLQQEGWHHDMENADGELTYKGVVFNEMKGYYSMPDWVMMATVKETMFPDSIYKHDMGGNPEDIPNLTYEQFKDFHETFYHPSNARVFFAGDDDPTQRLKLVNEFIAEFDRRDVDAEVALQEHFDEPVRTVKRYDSGEDTEKKGMVTVNWLLGETSADPEHTLALNILSHVLLGTPASPLRKALLDSGLGENLAGGGLATQRKQMSFSAGMRGIDPTDSVKIETLIEETLKDLAENGIDPATVEASLNTIEFQMREFNTGGLPRGLMMMFGTLSDWLYGADPVEALAFEDTLNAIREKATAGDGFFEKMIKEQILDNAHRSTVVLEPDPAVRQETIDREKSRIDGERAQMSEADIQQVVEKTAELLKMQQTPDSPEKLATLPMLNVDDLEREIRVTPRAVSEEGGYTTIHHDIATNGIAYIDVGFNMKALPAELLPYVPLFNRSIMELGTEKEDYIKLTQRIGSKTGGISPTRFLSETYKGGENTAWWFLRGKGTMTQTQDLLDLFNDILLTTNFDNPDRFTQIAVRSKASYEAAIGRRPIGLLGSRLRARFTETGWAEEQMSGVSNLFFLRDLIARLDSDWSSVMEKLIAIRDALFNRDAMMVNVTLDADNYGALTPQIRAFADKMPAKGDTLLSWTPDFPAGGEGLAAPKQVNFNGLAGNLYKSGYQKHGSIYVALKTMNADYIWDKVRLEGGAYGGRAQFSPTSGVLAFFSWDDPNLTGTLDTFKAAADYLRNIELPEEELQKAIIGTTGDMDSYQLPDAKGWSDTQRYLIGLSDEQRQQTRDEVFATTEADYHRLGEAMVAYNESTVPVVIASDEALSAANETLGDKLKITKVL